MEVIANPLATMETIAIPNDHDDDVHTDDDADLEDDAFNAWFHRGEFLRELRLLEQEDEAERQLQQAAVETDDDDDDIINNHNMLDYPHFLKTNRTRRIYDDYKHVNYEYVNLGTCSVDGNTNDNNNNDTDSAELLQPLIIQQDRSVGKGGLIWDAGYILADTLMQQQQNNNNSDDNTTNTNNWTLLHSDRPQRVLELGAGTGVTGLMLAKAFPKTAQVHLTDLPLLQPLLERNLKAAQLDNATCGVLEWGKTTAESSTTTNTCTKHNYDIIVGADVIAGIYSAPALLQTLCDLSHERTHIFLSTRDRLSGIADDFCVQLAERFEVVEKRMPCSDNGNPTVYILYITGKRLVQ